MPKTRLDHAFCLTAACEEGRKKTDYYDTAVIGFVLECRSTGGKTFYLRYDHHGRQRQVKLAAFGDAPFAQVKRKAERLRAEVQLDGNPAAAKAAARAVPTYAELAAQHAAFAETHLRGWESVEMILRVHLVPKWGRTRLTDVTAQAVGQWLAEKGRSGLAPATVEKIRAVMSRSFTLGAKLGVAGCDRNPVKDVPRRAFDNARTRFLDAGEVRRLLDAAAGSRNPRLPEIVTLLLATGARVSEVLGAEWANVDLERRTLFLPMTKNGQSRFVPLSGLAVSTLAGLREGRAKGARYVFPSPSDPDRPLGSIKHAWATACRGAGLANTKIHDLRHTAASAMVAAGIDLYSVGKVLGHKSHASSARYAHVSNARLLAAVEAGSANLTA